MERGEALVNEIRELGNQLTDLRRNDPTNHDGHEALMHELRDRTEALNRLEAEMEAPAPNIAPPQQTNARQGYLDRAYREVSQNIRNRHQNPGILQAIQQNGNTRQNLIQVMDTDPRMYGLDAYQPEFREELIERFRNEGLYTPSNEQTLRSGVQAAPANTARVAPRQPGRNAMSGAPERRNAFQIALGGGLGIDQELAAVTNNRPHPASQHATGEVQRAYEDLLGRMYRRQPQEQLEMLSNHLERLSRGGGAAQEYGLRSNIGVQNLSQLINRHVQVLRHHLNNQP
jgi:hypothetical protein